MMSYRHLLLFLFFLTAGFSTYAQQGGKNKITGKTFDAHTGSPLGYATVTLYSRADSTPVTGNITDDAGVFTLEAKPGTYFVKIDFLAYTSVYLSDITVSEGTAPVALGNIKMQPAATMLDEVVVQAEKSSMQLALDKKIFNVGKDLGNAGGNAADILSNIPSVSVDVDGNVSLRGTNNVKILIDGKPSGLVSFKGADGLRQLQGSLIDRVEVVTNASARYEAEGTGGIINIILKKERTRGLNGSFDLITGYPTNFGGAVNLNLRRERLNFFINSGVAYRNSPGDGSVYQEVYSGDTTYIYRQANERDNLGFNKNVRAGLDYFFNPKNILTAAYTWRSSKGERSSFLEYTDYLFSTDNPSGITTRTQDEQETEPNSEYALTYKKTFEREGHELTAEVRYLDNWEDSDQDFVERSFLPDYTPTGAPEVLEHSYNFETEKQLLLQLDYIHPFGKDGKFESGLRSTFRDMTNDYLVERFADGAWQPVDGLNNNFIYDENIHAAYAILGNKIKRFSYQLGLRAEMTDVSTILKQTDESNPRDYTSLFPSTHFTYDLPGQNAVQLSYSRRVRRPRYWDLNPFMTFTDNRNFFGGNPDLEPEFTNVFEIGHVKYMDQASLSSSLYYRHTTGKIERIRRVDDQGNATTRPENLSKEDAFGLEFTASYSPYKWWKVDGNFNFFRAITNGDNLGESFQSDTYGWFSRLTSKFSFWKGTDLQLRGNYESKLQNTQGYRKPNWFIDLAISKDILKNNGTLTLNVSDLFNTRRHRFVSEGDNFYTYNNFQWRARQINLTLNYRLHQQKAKPDKKQGEGEGGDF
ncbi:MAG: TonB-dependent receptor [Lewinellaceae bacterium]|nr:TonB-dependent receptor [Lewinellaceae bacterium]